MNAIKTMLKKIICILAGLCIVSIITASTTLAQERIEVTNGNVIQHANKFDIESKSSRFIFPDLSGNNIAIEVEYHGNTRDSSLLGSGKFISQVGLKLRSVNQCNLVYVMRRFEPKSEIVVLVKENEGQLSHQECENGGYTKIASIEVPKVHIGDKFSLETKFVKEQLSIIYNGLEIWNGNVQFNHQGNFGVRTDNARVSITLK